MALATAAVSLATAVPARADIGEKIILRCTHDQSLSGFSQSDYRKALGEMSADSAEYGSCEQRIRRAQEQAAGGGLRGTGAGGSGFGAAAGMPVAVAATPAQERAISHAAHARPEPISVGGRAVHPGVVHVDVASALSTLPTPLLVTLAFLLGCVALIVAVALRRRAHGHGD